MRKSKAEILNEARAVVRTWNGFENVSIPAFVLAAAREASVRDGRVPRPIRISRHANAWYIDEAQHDERKDAELMLVVYPELAPERPRFRNRWNDALRAGT